MVWCSLPLQLEVQVPGLQSYHQLQDPQWPGEGMQSATSLNCVVTAIDRTSHSTKRTSSLTSVFQSLTKKPKMSTLVGDNSFLSQCCIQYFFRLCFKRVLTFGLMFSPPML